jgi:AAA domain/Bifunctional DNA primase/polymerase, N-terminal
MSAFPQDHGDGQDPVHDALEQGADRDVDQREGVGGQHPDQRDLPDPDHVDDRPVDRVDGPARVRDFDNPLSDDGDDEVLFRFSSPERQRLMQRSRDRNKRMLDKHQQVFDALVNAGFQLVKVNAPLFERQESGQWKVVGCSCGNPICDKAGCVAKDHCHSPGKHPVGNGWQKYGTTEWTTARRWLLEGYNLGAYAAKGSRGIGIDYDSVTADSLYLDGVPPTMADTLGDKGHIFHTLPDGYDIEGIPGDFDGGELARNGSRHLVAPLGLHPRGARKWNGITEVTPIPLATLDLLVRSKRRADDRRTGTKPGEPGWKVHHGEGRYVFLTSEAGRLWNSLADADLLLVNLRHINEARCDPSVEDAFLVRLASNAEKGWDASGGHAGAGEGQGPSTGPEQPVKPLQTRRMADILMRITDWLWKGWLPLEEPAFIEGKSGVAKSAFVVDLVARLTTGMPMPDGSPHPTDEPMDIVWITGEDDPERVLAPRFAAAGADLTRIHFVEGKFTVPDDIPALEATIREKGARLVFIDPIYSHVSVEVNPNSDTQMRQQVMDPLRGVCRRTKSTILLARHINKATGQDISMRGSGSYGGTTGAARVVIYAMTDPDGEDASDKVIGVMKNNYAKYPFAMRFRTETALVTAPSGEVIETMSVVWTGEADDIIENIANRGSNGLAAGDRAHARRDAADAKVLDLLTGTGCTVQSDDLLSEMEEAGFSEYFVKGARRRLKVVAHSHEPSGPWFVRLPSEVCQAQASRARRHVDRFLHRLPHELAQGGLGLGGEEGEEGELGETEDG